MEILVSAQLICLVLVLMRTFSNRVSSEYWNSLADDDKQGWDPSGLRATTFVASG